MSSSFFHTGKLHYVSPTTYKRTAVEKSYFSFFGSYPPPYKNSGDFPRGPIDLIPFAKVGKSVEVYGKINGTDLKPLMEP